VAKGCFGVNASKQGENLGVQQGGEEEVSIRRGSCVNMRRGDILVDNMVR